jgi:hypothetical protein
MVVVGMSTHWERREQQRAEKLKQIDEQVASGSLVIREMTDAERKANPPRPRRDKFSGRSR